MAAKDSDKKITFGGNFKRFSVVGISLFEIPYHKLLFFIVVALGIFSFIVSLAYHNIADGDLWARLAQGASIWINGSLMHKDIFAFTPVLPEYIDHEWGTGLIFYFLLKLFGPGSLLVLKILAAVGALCFAIAAGRSFDSEWPALFLLALLGAAAIFPGFVLVVRSQAFTYFFFSVMFYCLEAIRRNRKWPFFIITAVMFVWANLHGGFAAGLGTIMIYTVSAYILKRARIMMSLTMLASVCVTFINPYGWRLWRYLIPALLHSRSFITEWHPMKMNLFDTGPYFGFRILFIVTAFVLVFGWKRIEPRKYMPGLITLFIALFLALQHRRHAPFFGLSAIAFLGPYLSAVLEQASAYVPPRIKTKPMTVILVLYGAVALTIASGVLPNTHFEVLAPVGFFPVRECDILMYSKAKGNLAVAFPWGNYAMWRLFPDIKISQCGRYETVYPASTIDMNSQFFYKMGGDWDRITRDYRVDYVILELNITGLKREDLESLGFEEIYSNGYSALWARKEMAPSLIRVAREIESKETIQPLDARIPENWWQLK